MYSNHWSCVINKIISVRNNLIHLNVLILVHKCHHLLFLTHWGRVTHICVGNLTIGSDNSLVPGRRQAITWTIVGILLNGPLGTNFTEMLIKIHTFSFKKIHLKMSSGKWRPFCLGLNVLNIKLNYFELTWNKIKKQWELCCTKIILKISWEWYGYSLFRQQRHSERREKMP